MRTKHLFYCQNSIKLSISFVQIKGLNTDGNHITSSISFLQTQTQRRVWLPSPSSPREMYSSITQIFKGRCTPRKVGQCFPGQQDKIKHVGAQILDPEMSMVRTLTWLTLIKEELSPGQVFLRSATWVVFRTPQVTLLRAALPDTYQKLIKRGTVAYAIQHIFQNGY